MVMTSIDKNELRDEIVPSNHVPWMVIKSTVGVNGQTANLGWGDQGQHVFFKNRNIPVILLGVGSEVTLVFNRAFYL